MDFSKLKRFDPIAAMAGVKLMCGNHEYTYIDGPDTTGKILVKDVQNVFMIPTNVNEFRMKPLAWVEDKPVYKGDTLYHRARDTVTAVDQYEKGVIVQSEDYTAGAFLENLSWIKSPRKVRREGWINIYKGGEIGQYAHDTEELAKREVDTFYVATIKIEWEEEQ